VKKGKEDKERTGRKMGGRKEWERGGRGRGNVTGEGKNRGRGKRRREGKFG